MAVVIREGSVGEKEVTLRFSQPKGQVTITSSKSIVSLEAVVMVTEGGCPLWMFDLKEVTFVEIRRSALANAPLAMRSRIDL